MFPELEEIQVERINERSSENKVNKRDLNMDMNPMVDLAFLLLTFFMLATTFSKPQAMELVIPAKPDPMEEEQEMAVKESKTVSIVLHDGSVIWYRGITDPETADLEYSELEAFFKGVNENTDGVVVLIKPDPKSHYEELVEVINALNQADVQRYAISDLSDFDASLINPNDE